MSLARVTAVRTLGWVQITERPKYFWKECVFSFLSILNTCTGRAVDFPDPVRDFIISTRSAREVGMAPPNSGRRCFIQVMM
uniref:Uncharacterized protein L09FR n=1 Tax=African swine fever virus TaxID=10497 RepID=Q8V9T9_ASF|nr:putative protein [African swine fever virus]